ncbi:MAG: hypothetical protein ACRD4O_01885 [Bryobacteraceae bacterium]
MERLEFLSGKYKDGERIVPGVVQTFQAAEAAGGRPVFVHRVPTTGPEAQNGVVRLLSAALLRSEGVRKLVVEVADQDGFCYVITENAEQCLLLREWLQFEIDRAGGQPAAPAARPSVPSAVPEPPPPARPELVPEKPAKPADERQPGDFSRLFQAPPPAGPASAPPAPSVPGRSETGEFTRFFRGDLLPGKKPAEPPRRPDRPSSSESLRAQRSSGAVQRPPNAPMTPLPQRSSDSGEMKRVPGSGGFPRSSEPGEFNRSASGEFARLFSAPENSGASLPSAPPANAGFNAMPPPANQEPGEYTRIFGKGNSVPPLAQPASPAPEASDRFEFFDGGSGPAGVENLPRGPSEYTRIIGRGEFSPTAPPRTEAAPDAPPAAAAPLAMAALPQVKLPPASAMPVAPHVPLPKPPAVPVAAPGNKRLAIFLVIIGLLAVALVIAVILLAKK